MEQLPLEENLGAGDQPDKPREKTWVKEVKDWVKTLCISFVIVLLIHQFVFNISIVQGHSMEPTLEDEERLFINKAVYWLGNPSRGDIVILKDPRPFPEGQFLVKRIVGAPGDTIEIHENRLYVNGQLYDHPYTADAPIAQGEFGPIVVPNEFYFVLGDNRGSSTDSRDFGVIPKELIKGRADFILWPVTKMGGL